MIPRILKNTLNHFWKIKTKTKKWLNVQNKLLNNQRLNPKIIDIKLVIIKHPKTSRILSRTIRRAKKVSEVAGGCKNSSTLLYSETTKTDIFLMKQRL